MFLGIEIGGTKLQVGVGGGDGGPLAAIERSEVDRAEGARGIRQQIAALAAPLLQRFPVRAVGIGFGGPIDCVTGRTIKSHHIGGWNDFPLVEWSRQTLGLPTAVANDADTAGLAEARFGAGRGKQVVFYVTVGSGIGGALILGGQIYRGGSGVAAEIGHLRPGLQSDRPDLTLEAIASGWGITAEAQARLAAEPMTHSLDQLVGGERPEGPESLRQRLIDAEEAGEEFAADLRERCEGRLEQLTTRLIGQAAAEGNRLAEDIFHRAVQALGWGVAQMITLLSPEVVVIGGGVPLAGETLFFAPLRQEVNRYVFPPLRNTFRVVPAALGEEVVIHGALALAAEALAATGS
jgi:glucokinase